MIVSRGNLAKIALTASLSSFMLYSPKFNLFAQPSGTTDEQKRSFVTLDNLIQDATLLEKHAPLSVSGPHKIFKLNNDKVIIEQDFALNSGKLIDDGLFIMFGEETKNQDPRDIFGYIPDVIQRLREINVQNKDLIDYIASFKAIRQNSFQGELRIVKFNDFQPEYAEYKNDLDFLIEKGIITPDSDYYFLPENSNNLLRTEAQKFGLFSENIPSKEKFSSVCKMLSQTIDAEQNPKFSNRSLIEAKNVGKGTCAEIVQYAIQIYYSTLKQNDSKLSNLYPLPVVFLCSKNQVTFKHAAVVLVDTPSKTMTLFDPTQVIKAFNEARRLRKKAQQTTVSIDKYGLELKADFLEAQTIYDCSNYQFETRRNNR